MTSVSLASHETIFKETVLKLLNIPMHSMRDLACLDSTLLADTREKLDITQARAGELIGEVSRNFMRTQPTHPTAKLLSAQETAVENGVRKYASSLEGLKPEDLAKITSVVKTHLQKILETTNTLTTLFSEIGYLQIACARQKLWNSDLDACLDTTLLTFLAENPHHTNAPVITELLAPAGQTADDEKTKTKK